MFVHARAGKGKRRDRDFSIIRYWHVALKIDSPFLPCSTIPSPNLRDKQIFYEGGAVCSFIVTILFFPRANVYREIGQACPETVRVYNNRNL